MNRKAAIAAVLTVLVLASGCRTAQAPDQSSGFADPEDFAIAEHVSEPIEDMKPGERPPLSSEEAGWWMAMDRMEAQAATAGNRVRDPALNAYVNEIVCRVAGPHCEDIRVYVMHVPHFNAMMGPNGVMLIWTGLILRARNEAQLATVIGHEIGHYLRRHTLQRMRAVRDTASFMTFFQMGLGLVGIPGLGDAASTLAIGALQAYSRDHEREADRIGLELMVRAGYDAREAAVVWKRVVEETKAAKERRPPLFYASHPPSAERQRTLEALAESRQPDGEFGNTGEDRFRAATGHMRDAFLRDELNVRNFDRAEWLLGSLIEDGWRTGELHFYMGEVHRLRAGAGKDSEKNLGKAVAEYEKAIAAGEFPARVHRSLGLIYARMQEPEKSRRAFRSYLDAVPDAADRLFVESMITPAN